eukprot:TRINITY_DN12278_c0_g1_i1.p1 TRINITY_DN12278_c0_g1~~TRINITY_DN12278_c0_g1_i1.p1  ORF type:complete len:750 (-),score=26.51 TRINITY_DN12278_c0_g1_i1:961-3210(-)
MLAQPVCPFPWLALCILGLVVIYGHTAQIDSGVQGPVVNKRSPTQGLRTEQEYKLEAGVVVENGNVSKPATTIAQVIDQALAYEFQNEANEEVSSEGKDYNETSKNKDASLETVVRLSSSHKHHTIDINNSSDTEGNNLSHSSSSQSTDTRQETAPQEAQADTNSDLELEDQEVDRIIDSHDNVFIMSNPHNWNALTLDPQLIQDLTVIFTTSAIGGSVSEILRQPIINSYLIAGSLVGPGALKWVKELVQVESLAQVGIQLLLFGLGLEFSFKKLAKVRNVAIYGGILEILIFVMVTGILAIVIGGSVYEGILIGAMLSMSSTSVVIKSLGDLRSHTSAFSQITVGTLILQDCTVGLMFALLPVLSSLAQQQGSATIDERGRIAMIVIRLLFKLLFTFALTWMSAVYVLPALLSKLYRSASKELFQLIVIGWCMVGAWLGGYVGISHELGAFLAGVMLSGSAEHAHVLETTEQVRNIFVGLFMAPNHQSAGGRTHDAERFHAQETQKKLIVIGWCMVGAWLGGYVGISHELGAFLAGVMLSGSAEHAHVLETTEQVRNIFVGLFMASIGLIMSPAFLWNHGVILASGTIVVVVSKAALIASVVAVFGFDLSTSLFVGVSLAQVGEFAFVLLSIGRQLELIHQHIYLMMLGVTALSLLVTPLMLQFSVRIMAVNLTKEEMLPLKSEIAQNRYNIVPNPLFKCNKHLKGVGSQQSVILEQLLEDNVRSPEPVAGNLTEVRERAHNKSSIR